LLSAQQSALEEAWNLAANGNRDAALKLLVKVVHDTPADADARLLYGSLLSEAGQGPEALLQLTEAVRLRPNSADAQNALGEADRNFGNSAAALASFQKAVMLKPDFAVARLNLGQSLIEANKLSSAAVQLDKAISLFGNNSEVTDARYLRAKVYASQGDFKSAAAQLDKAVSMRPDMAEAWSDLGQARKNLLDDPGALNAFERAVQANPGDAVAQYRLGAQYLESNQLDPAIEHLTKATELNSTDQSSLNSLQIAFRRVGKPQDADRVKKQLAAVLHDRDKHDQNALEAIKNNNLGAKLEKEGNLRGAFDKYQEALALDPSHVGIRVNYAVALLRLGKWNEGISELREALRRDPGNPSVKAALQDALKQAP